MNRNRHLLLDLGVVAGLLVALLAVVGLERLLPRGGTAELGGELHAETTPPEESTSPPTETALGPGGAGVTPVNTDKALPPPKLPRMALTPSSIEPNTLVPWEVMAEVLQDLGDGYKC